MRKAAHLVGLFVLALVGLAMAAQATPTPFASYAHPALEAINDAYLTGQIDRAQALLYRVYFVKDFDRLPEQFRLAGEPLKCGTPILLEAYEELEGLGRGDDIDELRTRPSNLTNTRTTAHYIIHYTLSGGDATTEAYVDIIEDACEVAWTAYHSTNNWDVPPGDGALGGGTNMIDCYVHTFGSGTLGYAEPENQVLPNPPYNDMTGLFHVNTSISNTSQRRVTVVHEYMHVVQFGYNASNNNSWFMENCAMMGEEIAYDTINDYRGYLSAWFGPIYQPMYTHDGQFEYGQITWPMWLTERHEAALVEDIWSRLEWAYSYFDIINAALAPYGYDVDTSFDELKIWGVYTAYRNDGQHFEEAASWNSYYYPDNIHNAYPTGNQHPGPGMYPDRLGSSFQCFLPQSGNNDNTLRVTYDGPACTIAVTLFRKLEGIAGHTEYYMTLDANGNGTIDIPGFDQSDWVLMLVNMSLYCGADNQDYIYAAETTAGSQAVGEDLAETRVRFFPNVPNPVVDRTALAYALPQTSTVDLRIVDASGRAVRTLYQGEQHPGQYEIMWNRTDDAGRAVESGVYYAIVRVDGEELTRQMTVLK